MITKFKLFEHPNFHDYVILDDENGIGVIGKVKLKFDGNNIRFPNDYVYYIEFENGRVIRAEENKIKFYSSDKEDVETYIAAKNFNL